ncbi:MAG: PEGA domain-containing protein [Patescibacteria group bacterium]
MDYLDPKKQLRHNITLFVGYVCIAIAIAIATIILLYQAYGFGLGKNGTVIQNGLTFFSSHPQPAKIYVNNQLKPVVTNTRLVLPAGIYDIKLARDGYRDWQRKIELDGGSVEHFDYPFLIPKDLTSKKIAGFEAAPGIMSQSPDHRWLVLQKSGTLTDFEVYDLKNPTKAPIDIAMPSTVLTKAAANESMEAVEWAGDNEHLLLQHNYDGKLEFVMLDRTSPEQSININASLSISPTKLTLNDKKFDRYYLYDSTAQTLTTATSEEVSSTPLLQNVLAYQSYGDDTVLYITNADAPSGKVLVKLRIGDKISTLRSFPVSASYLLDLTKYSGVMYVAVGSGDGSKVYIYKDPAGQLAERPKQAVSPVQVLHVPQPNYLSFSASAQFIVAQNGSHFGVYDIENDKGYSYVLPEALDAPQTHATWMDGNRLTFVSGGKQNIIDYDNSNRQALVSAGSQYLPAFAPNYKNVFTLAPSATAGQFDLNQTSLLTPADR